MAEDFDIEALLEAPYNVSTRNENDMNKKEMSHQKKKNFRYEFHI